MIRVSTLLMIALLSGVCASAQHDDRPPTRQDSLRGSITPERAWWDVLHYGITVEPEFDSKTLTGNIDITFRTKEEGNKLQLDLQQPMEITSIVYENKNLSYERDGNVFYVSFPELVEKNAVKKITVSFSGKPREAVNPPWDGGWIWKRDSYGNPWMSVACQGLGASVWYPCKDHQSDEPDSASLSIIVPDSLMGIGNGRLTNKVRSGQKVTYTWKVVSPINNYNIIPYIGRYINWNDTFAGEKGKLDLSYWVLQENEAKARKQFAQVKPMLKCFEHWFGPYPFYSDGFKLVESPHLGMEHQSAIAYGNGFANGYLGKDLSGTGWGNKWDFIIIHESGHEWFGNNLTTEDIADMWVHEGFTNYSEILYTTCEYGVEAGNAYLQGLRKNIQNEKPLITAYGVNKEGPVDMYAKGSNLVHMIRQLYRDDEKFRVFLRNMNRDFYHQNVTSKKVEKYISQKVGIDLSKVFDQYLRTAQIPVLEYRIAEGKLKYRWTNCVDGFNMPIHIKGSKSVWLYPSDQWKETSISTSDISIDPNFYVGSKQL